MVTRTCLNCGKTFQVPYPSSKRVNCSEKCRIARLRRPDRKKRADTGTRKSKWVKRKCPECAATFEVPPWRVRHAEKRSGRIFCSTGCNEAHWRNGRMMGEARNRVGRAPVKRTAKLKRKAPGKRRQPGARYVGTHGYIHIYVPPDERPPGAPRQRSEFPEHRIVMAKLLGRHLERHETVHHKNGIKTDNRPENLELWTGKHCRGVRVSDQLAWAREIIAKYGPVEDKIT